MHEVVNVRVQVREGLGAAYGQGLVSGEAMHDGNINKVHCDPTRRIPCRGQCW